MIYHIIRAVTLKQILIVTNEIAKKNFIGERIDTKHNYSKYTGTKVKISYNTSTQIHTT